jgi:hypothetical protein
MMRNITFDIFAPKHGDRSAVLHMVRNIQFLASMLENISRKKNNHEPLLTLIINLYGPIPSESDCFLANTASAPILSSCAWYNMNWDASSMLYKFTSATCLFKDTLAMVIAALPFRCLHSITDMELNLPDKLSTDTAALAFKTGFEADLRSTTPVDRSRELKLDSFMDALEHCEYKAAI